MKNEMLLKPAGERLVGMGRVVIMLCTETMRHPGNMLSFQQILYFSN